MGLLGIYFFIWAALACMDTKFISGAQFVGVGVKHNAANILLVTEHIGPFRQNVQEKQTDIAAHGLPWDRNKFLKFTPRDVESYFVLRAARNWADASIWEDTIKATHFSNPAVSNARDSKAEFALDFASGRIARICKKGCNSKGPLVGVAVSGFVAGKIGANFSLSQSPRLHEGLPDVINAHERYHYRDAGHYQKAKGPIGHIPLGGKIALAALMLAGGVYYFYYALRYVGASGEGAALFYLFLGIGGIFCGVTLGLHAAFGM